MPTAKYNPPTSSALPPAIKEFFSHFYQMTDTNREDAHELYAKGFFTADAVLMVLTRVVGTDGMFFLLLPLWLFNLFPNAGFKRRLIELD